MVEVPEGYSLPYGARYKLLQQNFMMQVFKAGRGKVRRRGRSGGMYYTEGFIHDPIGVVKVHEGVVKFDMLPVSGTWKPAETVQAAITAICTIHRMRGGE